MSEQNRLPEHIDFPALHDTVGGDLNVLDDLLEQTSRDLPVRLRALDDALKAGDAEQLRIVAHSTRGFLASIQARSARRAAEAVDRAARDGDAKTVRETVRQLHRESEDLLDAIETWRKGNGNAVGDTGVPA